MMRVYIGVDRDGKCLKERREMRTRGVNIDFLSQDARTTKAPVETGLLMTNPPYGFDSNGGRLRCNWCSAWG